MPPDSSGADQLTPRPPRWKRILRSIVEWRFYIMLALLVANMIWWFVSGRLANWKATAVFPGLILLMYIDSPTYREHFKRLIRRSWGIRIMLAGALLVLPLVVFALLLEITASSNENVLPAVFDKSGSLFGFTSAVFLLALIGGLIAVVGMLVTLFEIT